MNRRSLLQLVSGGIGAVWALVIAVPGIRFILAPLTGTGEGGALSQRVAPLDDLPAGQPVQRPIVGAQRDAWNVYPNQTLGRVWLVRTSDEAAPPEEAVVRAFSAICPHLGCLVDFDAADERFVCPCHKAAFQVDGDPLSDDDLERANAAPRGMDPLECRVVSEEETGQWWVEVDYQQFELGGSDRVVRG